MYFLNRSMSIILQGTINVNQKINFLLVYCLPVCNFNTYFFIGYECYDGFINSCYMFHNTLIHIDATLIILACFRFVFMIK